MEEELKQMIGMALYQDIRKLYVREISKREIQESLEFPETQSENTVKKSMLPGKRHIATGEAPF